MNFTWLYQGTKAALFFFMLFITYRYGHLHLGHPDDAPEFSTFAYFCMMFSVATGPCLLVYNVVEPLLHQQSNFYAQTGYRSQDEIDMFAITLTLSNWGITSWTHFTVLGVCMSLAFHRFRLPMTFRSCFYPMLGPFTWGWIGDCIDGTAIVVTFAGVVTAMGSMSNQLVSGFNYLGWLDAKSTDDQITSIQNTVVWIITAVSISAVISGIHGAIPKVSMLAVSLGFILMFLVLVMDDTKFLLNLIVQSVGTTLQTNLFLNNFWTDAFGQLREGSGRSVDGKSAETWWMDKWTVFYLAWIVTWTPFVSMCTAIISRGRKLWEVVAYGFFAPVCFCIVWYCVWGGVALRQSRQGKELAILGEVYFNNSGHFLSDGSEVCYNVPQTDVLVDNEVVFANKLPGITPVCQFDSSNEYRAIFNVLHSFSFPHDSFGEAMPLFLSVLYFVIVPAMFLAVSATAALVVDTLASNGRKNQHWTRRFFWVVTFGSVSTVLLSSGGDKAMFAMQDASIVSALPFAILLCYAMQSIVLLCRATEHLDETDDYKIPDQPDFTMPIYGGVFNVMEHIVSFGRIDTARVDGMVHRVTKDHVCEFIKGLVVPFVSLHQILLSAYPRNRKTNAVVAVCFSLTYVGWISLAVVSGIYPALKGLLWTMFVLSGCVLAKVRSGYRTHYNLRSNALADLLGSLFFWPQVLAQMKLHSNNFHSNRTERQSC